MTTTLRDLLALASSEARFLLLAPHLRISKELGAAPAVGATFGAGAQPELAVEGVGHVPGVATPPSCLGLVHAIEALRAHDLPAAFVYAFDEPWALGEAIRARVSTLVGCDYVLVEDIWAWQIPPGSGGWPPHRGVSHVRLDRERPEVINVWVALSEVTADRACMHAVPLADDPGYPDALQRLDAPLESVRALPVSAGDALFWNANVLHWGGRCAARAPGPRVSCSFTLRRADAAAGFEDLALLRPLSKLGLTSRMDALARMILLYGQGQSDVSASVHEWATVTHQLASRFAAPS